MPKNLEDQILQELKKMNRLLAVTSLRDLSNRDRIDLLSNVGFAPKEIADLIGTTPNTVSVELSKLRRRKRPGKEASP